MSIGDLLELIVCTECKTRVEYHDDRDGYMSCECWIRSTPDDPMPIKWVEIEDRISNLCGGCNRDIPERHVFRCADCGRPFHQTCLNYHCKHGDQPQELRSRILFLESQLAAKDAELERLRLLESRLTEEGVGRAIMKDMMLFYDDWEDAFANLPMEAEKYLKSARAVIRYVKGEE